MASIDKVGARVALIVALLALQPVVGNLPFPSAWGVFFRTGEIEGLDSASAFYVRAVRGGP